MRADGGLECRGPRVHCSQRRYIPGRDRSFMSRVLTVLSIPLVLLVLLAGPATAAEPGRDPFRLGWPGFTETVPTDGPASAEAGCARGSTTCVDQVVAA